MTQSKQLPYFLSVALIKILLVYNQVAAEIHQRLMEEEKENQPTDTKEKSPQMGTNKKVKNEPPKKKTADKKAKGIPGFSSKTVDAYASPW